MHLMPLTSNDVFPRAEAEKIAGMLNMLTWVGVRGELLLTLLDMNIEAHGHPPLKAADRKFVGGPIICHSGYGGWGPDWDGHPVHKFSGQIRQERVEIALGLAPWTVGPTEIMCVMYAATADAPLRSDLADVYIWAASHALARQTKSNGTYLDVQKRMFLEDRWRDLSDDFVLNKEPYATHIREISADIRRKVENASGISRRTPANQSEAIPITLDLFSKPA